MYVVVCTLACTRSSEGSWRLSVLFFTRWVPGTELRSSSCWQGLLPTEPPPQTHVNLQGDQAMAGKMAQWLETLATEAERLTLIPGTHRIEELTPYRLSP